MHRLQTDPVVPFSSYFGRNLKTLFFSGHNDGDPGWGTELRQNIYTAACTYMNVDPYKADSIFGVGLNSIFQSDYLEMSGGLLEAVQKDVDMLAKQKILIENIRFNPRYRVEIISDSAETYPQFGGYRAKGEMWQQLLEVWKWTDEYSATWDVAFDELTWAVRSTTVYVDYVADLDGTITLNSHFEDTLDLRPSWENRSMEYNAACVILGFLYHDSLGGSDELKTKAKWTTVIQPQ